MQAEKKRKLAKMKKKKKIKKSSETHLDAGKRTEISQQRIKEVILLSMCCHPVRLGEDKEMKITKRLVWITNPEAI